MTATHGTFVPQRRTETLRGNPHAPRRHQNGFAIGVDDSLLQAYGRWREFHAMPHAHVVLHNVVPEVIGKLVRTAALDPAMVQKILGLSKKT